MPRTALPTLTTERAWDGAVVGVDEAGCAPLAGPVVAAAVVLPQAWRRRPKALAGLTDSKQLSAAERERLYTAIMETARVAVGAASAAEIDRINIRRAALTAMRRAVLGLDGAAGLRVALVDGNQAPDLPCPVRTVVGGDASVLSIAAASVVAKVTRDRLMAKLARRHPGYGWETNQGYPTEAHHLGLLRLGPTSHHRLSFAPLRRLAAPYPAGGVAACGLRLVALRRDLHAVLDGGGTHVGLLRAVRGRWTLAAVAADRDGGPVPGGGPLARWHGATVAAPEAAALDRLLAGRG